MVFAEFILAHDGDDLGALALARSRYAGCVEWPSAPLAELAGETTPFDLALSTLEVRRKLRTKAPGWYAVPSLCYPLRLSGEQCSSAETARYKASVAAAAVSCPSNPTNKAHFAAFEVLRDPKSISGRVADLTGGLGVDSWAFSERFGEVLYCEMQPALAAAARENFAALGLGNVRVKNCRVVPGDARSGIGMTESLDGMTVPQALGDFKPDLIYLDPARRASDGRKVFRLEDCQPDVLKLLPELFAACPLVLLKLSPMADISLVCKQLGHVCQVHVVASEGECKELLLLLERGYEGDYAISLFEKGAVLSLNQVQGGNVTEVDQVQGAEVSESDLLGESILSAGVLLFEPGKALLKAGAFNLPCQYGLQKLGVHTHLYTGSVPEALKPFGKTFQVLEVVPLNNRSIREIGRRYPEASVTARNIPLPSDALRKKLGVRDGGKVHLFGARIDALAGNYLLVCAGA